MRPIGCSLALLCLLLSLAACNLPGLATPQPDTPTPPAPTIAPPTPLPTVVPATAAPTPRGDPRPEEAISILEPGAGSRLRSPARVTGIADPTFEQNLGIRILTMEGTELAAGATTIQAELGERGPFAAEIPFSVAGETPGLIQVYASSARDGGLTHLASTPVTLMPSGTPEIVPAAPHPELIHIRQPTIGATVSGGEAHVEGLGLASFEGTLVIEIYDAAGALVGSQPVIVAAPDMGQPGPFSADVPYRIAASGPGRVVVRDLSPAFGGDVHLASVEITLQP